MAPSPISGRAPLPERPRHGVDRIPDAHPLGRCSFSRVRLREHRIPVLSAYSGGVCLVPVGVAEVLDGGVRPGEVEADVAVALPADAPGWLAVGSIQRDDLAVAFRLAQVPALDDHTVAH